MATFFTADWHLGHENIIKLCKRPFLDLGQMAHTIRTQWNHVVQPGDDVIVLGDVSLRSVVHHRDFIESLHGTKWLVPGNHDACWGGHRRKERARRKRQEYLDAGFFYVFEDVTEITIPGFGDVRLSHLPTEGDSQVDDRYDDYRPEPDGKPVICGHVHESWSVKGLNINVGVDVRGFRPVHESEVASLAHRVMTQDASATR